MNVETGEIKEIGKLTPAQLISGKWKRLGKRPNPGCKHCHGRGWTDRDVASGEVIQCKCVKVRPERIKKY